jgi:hypothetical protein
LEKIKKIKEDEKGVIIKESGNEKKDGGKSVYGN